MARRGQKERSATGFVYGHLARTKKLVFLREDTAQYLEALWRGLQSATTWGELVAVIPADEYQRLAADHEEQRAYEDDEEDVAVRPDDPFDPMLIAGFEMAEYPGWLEGHMLRDLPESIREQFGRRCYSYASGDGHSLDDESPAPIVKALEGLGITCRHDDALVQGASPLE